MFWPWAVRCLSIPLAADFQPGSTVLDVGTGGGLPGLVSAICAPDVRFTLVDTQRKKNPGRGEDGHVARREKCLALPSTGGTHRSTVRLCDGTGCDTLAHISADGHEELAGRHCR